MPVTRPAPRPASRRTLLACLALGAAALAGCAREPSAGSGPAAGAAGSLLAPHGLEGRDARSVIDALEALPLAERPTDLLAAVRPEALVLTGADGAEASLPLPAGESYVSVAPFVRTTHECFIHSLTTCLGEMPEQDLEVRVTTIDAEVLVDEVRATAPNGFLGLWLPRDQRFTLTLAQGGASVSAPLATDAEAPTCLTTMQLGA